MSVSEQRARVQQALKALNAQEKMKRLADGFENALTGAGTVRSKVSAGGYARNDLLTPDELETLFQDNDLAYKIVSKPVKDALRGGFMIERPSGYETSDEDTEAVEQIQGKLKELKFGALIAEAAVFGRLFGGAGVVLGLRGAGSLATPLDVERVTDVETLFSFDRQDMIARTWLANGEVETYLWTQPVMGATATVARDVHASRLLMFCGATTTRRGRNRNQGWHFSVLQRVYEVLRSFDGMYSSVDSMFADASQAVFHLQGLIAALAEADGSGDKTIQTRLALMDMTRSSGKAVVLDAGDENGAGAEDFKVIDRAALGTLAPMIEQYYIRLAAAAEMPVTVLVGMAPSGMSATGESDLILYYNTVDTYRRSELQGPIEDAVRLVARALGTRDPDAWVVTWPELARPKPLDVATAEKMAIDSAVALITNQVVAPEEVALSLKKIAPGLRLDLDAAPRRKALSEAMEELGNRELTSPAPLPEMEPEGGAPPEKMSERKTPSKARGQQDEGDWPAPAPIHVHVNVDKGAPSRTKITRMSDGSLLSEPLPESEGE